MEIIVREAKPDEVNIIVEFQIQMALETENINLEKDVVTKGVEAVFKDITKGQYWLAEINNNVVSSMLMTREWSDWRNKWVLWFQSVFVLAEYRKQGVFKEMYSKLKNYVLESDSYAGLRLYVDKSNLKAQKVYKNMGMNGEHYKFFEWMAD